MKLKIRQWRQLADKRLPVKIIVCFNCSCRSSILLRRRSWLPYKNSSIASPQSAAWAGQEAGRIHSHTRRTTPWRSTITSYYCSLEKKLKTKWWKMCGFKMEHWAPSFRSICWYSTVNFRGKIHQAKHATTLGIWLAYLKWSRLAWI